MRSPLDWPGAHSVRQLLTGELVAGHWIDRTLEYQARRKRTSSGPELFVCVETLALSPLPCWRHLSPEARQHHIANLVASIEADSARQVRSSGRMPAGREFLQRQYPHLEPNHLKKRPVPLVHAMSRRIRRELREAFRLFLAAYRQASEQLRRGDHSAVFPEGCFLPPLPFQGSLAPSSS